MFKSHLLYIIDNLILIKSSYVSLVVSTSHDILTTNSIDQLISLVAFRTRVSKPLKHVNMTCEKEIEKIYNRFPFVDVVGVCEQKMFYVDCVQS